MDAARDPSVRSQITTKHSRIVAYGFEIGARADYRRGVPSPSRCSFVSVLTLFLFHASSAHADDPPPDPAPTPPASAPAPAPAPPETAPAPTTTPTPAPTSNPDVVPSGDASRRSDLTPRPAEPPPPHGIRFQADPVGDTGIIVLATAFTLLSTAVLGTGEIRPQQISATFKPSSLLGIDRIAVRQKLDSNAGTLSNVGLFAAAAYAATDTVLDIFREGKTAAIADFVMYAEAASITQGVTNVTKVAFRRPRPIAYIDRNNYLAKGGDPATYDNASTDSALSFFSGHAAAVASFASAATYIAFSRSPRSARPWLTLAGGALLTGFTSYERVRSGAHFPTDVLAGSIVGAGIGAVVVYLHREDSVRQRPVWIGAAPLPQGGSLSASGFF
jgi:undecaprenyl-diphosphatase